MYNSCDRQCLLAVQDISSQHPSTNDAIIQLIIYTHYTHYSFCKSFALCFPGSVSFLKCTTVKATCVYFGWRRCVVNNCWGAFVLKRGWKNTDAIKLLSEMDPESDGNEFKINPMPHWRLICCCLAEVQMKWEMVGCSVLLGVTGVGGITAVEAWIHRGINHSCQVIKGQMSSILGKSYKSKLYSWVVNNEKYVEDNILHFWWPENPPALRFF